MSDLFQDQYRIESTRLIGWDYSSPGIYFVTICTKNKKHFFGDIKNGIMILSDIGNIVHDEWMKTGTIRKCVNIDEFIVMPNHVHGIIQIKYNNIQNVGVDNPCRDAMPGRLYGKRSTLGNIINQFKTICTKQIWKLGYKNFAWQSRYYDRIIRDETELYFVRQYIQNNPLNWDLDRNHAKHKYQTCKYKSCRCIILFDR